MYSGNTLFPLRQKFGNNPRLKLFSACIFLSLLCISHLLSTHYNYFMPSQLPPKHPKPDHLGYVHQIASVTLCTIIKNNVWGFIFHFEGIRFLLIKDAMINTAVCYMYTYSLMSMSMLERSVAPNCEHWDAAPAESHGTSKFMPDFSPFNSAVIRTCKGKLKEHN